MVYGGPRLALETGRRVREMHKQVKGLLPNGERYHSLEPEPYAWVHATLADAIVRANARFVRPIPAHELETFWAEWKRLGRFLGVREHDLPVRWADFADYFDSMVRERLEHTDSVDDVLDALGKPPPPSVKGLSDPLWRLIRGPAAHGGRLGTVGLMPPELRRQLGLPWSRGQQLQLRAVGAASLRVGPLLPGSVKTFGPSYLRWRREAIARGQAASGVGSRFEPASPQAA
jgi:uncharacterized protein (DUF2236 family)